MFKERIAFACLTLALIGASATILLPSSAEAACGQTCRNLCNRHLRKKNRRGCRAKCKPCPPSNRSRLGTIGQWLKSPRVKICHHGRCIKAQTGKPVLRLAQLVCAVATGSAECAKALVSDEAKRVAQRLLLPADGSVPPEKLSAAIDSLCASRGPACVDQLNQLTLRQPAPSLSQHHAACDRPQRARSAVCVSAAHRTCAARGANFGVTQEVSPTSAKTDCAHPAWYGDVPLAALTRLHGGCTALDQSQTANCIAATHRYCSQRNGGWAGLAQEVGRSVFGVACLPTLKKVSVSFAELSRHHSGCNGPGQAQTSDCYAAAHRYCGAAAGNALGIVQEVAAQGVTVACIPRASSADVPFR